MHARICSNKYLHKKFAPEKRFHSDANAVFCSQSHSPSHPLMQHPLCVRAQALHKAAVEGNLPNILRVFILSTRSHFVVDALSASHSNSNDWRVPQAQVHGADLDWRDRDGMTALMKVRSRVHSLVIMIARPASIWCTRTRT